MTFKSKHVIILLGSLFFVSMGVYAATGFSSYSEVTDHSFSRIGSKTNYRVEFVQADGSRGLKTIKVKSVLPSASFLERNKAPQAGELDYLKGIIPFA